MKLKFAWNMNVPIKKCDYGFTASEVILDCCERGNSCPQFGHLANPHCTEDGQPEQAKVLPYVMSKLKPHFGQRIMCFGCEPTLNHFSEPEIQQGHKFFYSIT